MEEGGNAGWRKEGGRKGKEVDVEMKWGEWGERGAELTTDHCTIVMDAGVVHSSYCLRSAAARQGKCEGNEVCAVATAWKM